MKRLKNPMFIGGLSLLVVGLVVLFSVWFMRSPSCEITRAELEELIRAKAITEGQITPTPYAGIYHVTGTRTSNGKPQKFFVTSHMDEAQAKDLFAQAGVRIDMPGQGTR